MDVELKPGIKRVKVFFLCCRAVKIITFTTQEILEYLIKAKMFCFCFCFFCQTLNSSNYTQH